VKVIAKQTVGVYVGDRRDVLSIELQEVCVIPFLTKQVLTIVATIVDVIVPARFKRDEMGHGFPDL
jgi:hypothetical protein